MAETVFEELRRYVRLDEADARELARFRPIAAPHFERIAQEFYDRIREHEEAHAVFTGEAQIARLRRSLVSWLGRLLSGKYDEAYFEETASIGRVHVRVGLPQKYLFTAMALIRVSLLRLAYQADGGEAIAEALMRLLDVELGILTESYREDSIKRLQRSERGEKLKIDRALAQTEHRYVNAVELARAMIVGLDAKGAIKLFNREAERVTGYARDEVLTRSFLDVLFPEELRETQGAQVLAALEGKVERDVLEGALRARSGRIREIRWQLAYAPSDIDEEVVLFAIGQDITEELALAERTRVSEKLAAVGTLAAGLAHEIRNPLNGAQLHVSFLERALKKHKDGGEMLEAVQVVGDEIQRLANLVTDFLDFARPKPLEIKSVSVRSLCERAQQLVLAHAEQSHVQILLDLPPTDLWIAGDGPKLEQVLLNLIQNAIDALAGSAGGSVTMRARRRPRHVLLEVEDNGPGIPSPDAPIFDAFYSTKPAGTGLGLAITHRIVSDHKGTIDVQSRPGRTAFSIMLPYEAANPST